MRGTPSFHVPSIFFRRIIPAYAGNTVSARMLRHSARDHPRICGEHIAKNLTTGEVKGSSPHMRGTQSTSAKPDYCSGIIPAYAGNTTRSAVAWLAIWDHPRICGEHLVFAAVALSTVGSSPHMRGTLFRQRHASAPVGIIPAYAGNTWM